MINYVWRKIRSDILMWSDNVSFLEITVARVLTLLAVIIGWVYFRAGSVTGANHLVSTMFGFYGVSLPPRLEAKLGGLATQLQHLGFVFEGTFGGVSGEDYVVGTIWIILLLLISIIMPNTQQFVARFNPTIEDMSKKRLIETSYLKFSFTYFWCFIVSVMFAYSVIHLSRTGEFLYFNF